MIAKKEDSCFKNLAATRRRIDFFNKFKNEPMQPDLNTPLEFFRYWEKATPNRTFLVQPIEGNRLEWTYQSAGVEIRRFANYLQSRFPADSRIAILSKNCAHWIMADLAMMMAGHTSVPIYPTLSGAAINQLLVHSDCEGIIIGKLDDFKSQEAGLPERISRVVFDAYNMGAGEKWSEIIRNTSPIETIHTPDKNQMMTIMYSSGTTGIPKGVMLSHHALAYVAKRVARAFGMGHETFFSYLPLSHIAERGFLEMPALCSGSTICFAESLETFAEDIRRTQPTLFGGVPRIWAKFQEGIHKKLPEKKLQRLLSIPVVSHLIKRTIRKKLGFSKTHLFVSGAAPIPLRLLTWYAKLGIFIREVYGMTENTAYAFCNLDSSALGSVGTAWPDAICRLGEDDEILIKSDALMLGYFRNPEATKEAFTEDGFLRTGDKGRFDANGNLHIIGRVKDQFKTDKGKYISPAPIEMQITTETIIEQACVVGMGVPQPMCILTLTEEGRNAIQHEVEASIVNIIQRTNALLETFEQIKCAIVLRENWTIENGFLTPSLKIKRNEIEAIYLKRYQEWYYSGKPVVWL